MSSGRVFIFIVAALMFTPAAFASAPVYKPAPIMVSGLTITDISRAVHLALLSRGWEAEIKRPDSIVAVIWRRKKFVKLDIAFNESAVTIRYASSNGMGERISTRTDVFVSGKVNKWMRNVEHDISAYLKRYHTVITSEQTMQPGIADVELIPKTNVTPK